MCKTVLKLAIIYAASLDFLWYNDRSMNSGERFNLNAYGGIKRLETMS